MLKILGLFLGFIFLIHGILALNGRLVKSLRFLLLTSTFSFKKMQTNSNYLNWVGKMLIFQGLVVISAFSLLIVGIDQFVIFAIMLILLFIYFVIFYLGQKKYLGF